MTHNFEYSAFVEFKLKYNFSSALIKCAGLCNVDHHLCANHMKCFVEYGIFHGLINITLTP